MRAFEKVFKLPFKLATGYLCRSILDDNDTEIFVFGSISYDLKVKIVNILNGEIDTDKPDYHCHEDALYMGNIYIGVFRGYVRCLNKFDIEQEEALFVGSDLTAYMMEMLLREE